MFVLPIASFFSVATCISFLLGGYFLAGLKGFEPSISSVTGKHVRPLHHSPKLFDCTCANGSECITLDLPAERDMLDHYTTVPGY